MKRSCLLLIVLLLVCIPVLSGCWDQRELEERTSVVALAIDLEKKANSKPLTKVSVQIPIPIKIAGSGGGTGGAGGTSAVRVLTQTGKSLGDALQKMQERLNQQLFYGHTRVIAISDEMAKQGIEGIIDALRRDPQTRRLLWFVVVPGEAKKLLQVDPKLEQIPIVYVMDQMESLLKMEQIADATLGRFFIELSDSGIQPSANVIVVNKNDVKWNGLAVFNNTQMVGQLPADEVETLIQTRDHRLGEQITFSCPADKQSTKRGNMRKYITLRPKHVQTKRTVSGDKQQLRVNFDVTVETDVIESMCPIDFRKPENIKLIEQTAEKEMNSRAKRMVNHVQGQFHLDVLGVGKLVRAFKPQVWEQVNWTEAFEKTKIQIRYHVKIRRVGMKLY